MSVRAGSRPLPWLVKCWFLVSVTRSILDVSVSACRWLDIGSAAAAAAFVTPTAASLLAAFAATAAFALAAAENATAIGNITVTTATSMATVMNMASTPTPVPNDAPQAVEYRRRRHKRKNRRDREDMSLWIDKSQVKMFSGYEMEIFAIANGQVQPYILDPNFEDYLPVIPSTVGYVNFTWKSGSRKYFYHFELLESSDERILESPIVSVDRKGRVPKKPKTFSVLLPCSGNATGVAGFSIGLNIQTRKGKALPGTPLRLRLRKECTEMVGPDPECDKKCANGGWCNHDKICQCPEGYMGQYCTTALCYPQCMNGGSCTKPGVCSCPPGFHGNHCEGGICQQKCLNNGKCIQKDTCLCPKGFYGSRCEFSKCVIPCLNGGRCRGVNVCRCPWGFRGAHCEIDVPAAHARKQLRQAECRRPCRNGYCVGNNRCKCEPGWYGKLCQRRNPTVRSAPTPELGERPPKRKRVWV